MIPASEALLLPTAVLKDEELAAADKLEKAIEEHVRQTMAFRGCDEFVSRETNPNVISLVIHRLDAAGFNAQCQIIVEKHRFNAALQEPVGFKMNLSPKIEVYRDLQRTSAH